MTRILIFLLVLNTIQSCNKKAENKLESKTEVLIDYSGDYSGTFSDFKNVKGKMDLSIYQLKNGYTGGILTMKMNNSRERIITGSVNVMGDGNILNGNFTPSVIDYPDLNAKPGDSYQCRWTFYGKIKSESENTIIGKAVPDNCSESNLIEFYLERKK